MKEKCIFEEILNFGYGTIRYFSKNARRIFEEIKKEAKQTKTSDLSKIIKEMPKTVVRRFIKNLGFITEEDIKK